MKYLFAVNPVSGKNKAKAKMNLLAKLLKKHNFDFIIYETQPYRYANHLKEVIINNNITHVFAVGGDGTAHEVLNACVNLDVFYGVIPFGSGNDFARMLKLPKKIDKVFTMIQNNNYRLIDIGKFNDRYFANYISFGFDVAICKDAQKFKKIAIGGSSYLFGFFNALFSYKCKEMKINNYQNKVYLATIHNGQFYGGGMKINPLAQLDDGQLDLCVIKAISKLKLFILFPSVFLGKHFNFKKSVYYEKNNKFTINTFCEVVAGVDGEFYTFNDKINIEIIPQCIKIIC